MRLFRSASDKKPSLTLVIRERLGTYARLRSRHRARMGDEAALGLSWPDWFANLRESEPEPCRAPTASASAPALLT
jgi:hypothetical protein